MPEGGSKKHDFLKEAGNFFNLVGLIELETSGS